MLFEDNYDDSKVPQKLVQSHEQIPQQHQSHKSQPKDLVIKQSSKRDPSLKQLPIKSVLKLQESVDSQDAYSDFNDGEAEEIEAFKKSAQEFTSKLQLLNEMSDFKQTNKPKKGATELDNPQKLSKPQIPNRAIVKQQIPHSVDMKYSRVPEQLAGKQQPNGALIKQGSLVQLVQIQRISRQMDNRSSKSPDKRAKLTASVESVTAATESPTMIKSLQQKNLAIEKTVNKQRQQYEHPEDRNPFKFIEQALTEAKQKIEKMKSTPQVLESLPDNDKKKKYLKAENKLLRENLKRMSDNVNILIEKMNQEQQRKVKKGNFNGSVNLSDDGGYTLGNEANSPKSKIQYQSQIGSTAGDHAANTDKAILNLMKEHAKLKKRLEIIQQPNFLVNLKRDLRITEEEIKQQEKLKRQLKVDQLKREKKLDNIMAENEPDVMKQVQDTTQRLAYLTEKLQKLDEENVRAEELRNQQLAQLEELKVRLDKLNKIAEHYGVSIEKSKENHAEQKKLQEQLDHLNKQKRILTQSIDTQTKKQEAMALEKKKDLEQLQIRKLEILKKYNERVSELRDRAIQIKELIDRAKIEADPSLHEILDKWEQANDRILKKYPDGAEMNFDLLESSDQLQPQVATLNRKNPKAPSVRSHQVPDEMSMYLQEIRQKQKEIETKQAQDKEAEIQTRKERDAQLREAQLKKEAEERAKKEDPEVVRLKLQLKREQEEREQMEQDHKREMERKLKEQDDLAIAERLRLQKERDEAHERLKRKISEQDEAERRAIDLKAQRDKQGKDEDLQSKINRRLQQEQSEKERLEMEYQNRMPEDAGFKKKKTERVEEEIKDNYEDRMEGGELERQEMDKIRKSIKEKPQENDMYEQFKAELQQKQSIVYKKFDKQ